MSARQDLLDALLCAIERAENHLKHLAYWHASANELNAAQTKLWALQDQFEAVMDRPSATAPELLAMARDSVLGHRDLVAQLTNRIDEAEAEVRYRDRHCNEFDADCARERLAEIYAELGQVLADPNIVEA